MMHANWKAAWVVVAALTCAVVVGGAAAAGPVTNGLTAWYKADSLDLVDGDYVELWPDSSGNGLDLVATEYNGYVLFKANGLNGLPVVQRNEDWASDLWTGGYDGITSPLLASVEFDVFVVQTNVPNWTGGTTLTIEKATFQEEASIGHIGAVVIQHKDSSDANTQVFSSAGWGGPMPVIMEGVWGQAHTDLKVYRNGDGRNDPIVDHTGKVGNFAAVNRRIRFGWRNQWWNGDVGEILIYTRKLTDAEREQNGMYLGQKWGIDYEVTPTMLEGSVSLEDFSGDLSLCPVRISLVPTGSGTAQTEQMTLTSNPNQYSFRVEPGTYDISFSSARCPTTTLSGVVVSSGATKTLDPVALPGGDADGDNDVTTTDLSIAIKNMD